MKSGWNETSYNFTISSNVTWTSLLTSSLLYACLIYPSLNLFISPLRYLKNLSKSIVTSLFVSNFASSSFEAFCF